MHALYSACDGLPGVAGLQMSSVYWEALEVVREAVSWRLDAMSKKSTLPILDNT